MNSIHRIQIPVEDYQEVDLTGPPISVAADRNGANDVIDLWFEHMDGDRPAYEPDYHCTRAIYIFGTGHPVPWNHFTRYAWHFLGTVVTPSGFLVWHVYTGPKTGESIAL